MKGLAHALGTTLYHGRAFVKTGQSMVGHFQRQCFRSDHLKDVYLALSILNLLAAPNIDKPRLSPALFNQVNPNPKLTPS